MSNIKVALEAATNLQLRWYAGTALGIDGIKSGQQNTVLISKIKAAAPDTVKIEVPEHLEADPTTGVVQVGAPTPENPEEAMVDMHPRAQAHYRFDPKVKVAIGEAYSPTKVKDVQLTVCGDTITVQRGHTVDMPYRFYLALAASKETLYRDTDEINPQTGIPYKEAYERPTINHSLAGPLPSAEEIADFHRRTDDVSL